ncbi:glycosyltransferase family 4 protein [Kaistella antarctica]|uniref:Probable poly(Glycerol-phosphate) alpha-glucosyltransferase n=1 Tax=Kaistella antarctica TaxID=266748 RepID=A0A448NRI2_9FLAO|nr:glycosyltransferase family 4 protein [Kaistella antarctica]KEY18782.1 hypothetical protein HY04_09930 [Kaistella antarctica]SEW15487.1 Glycosyltransferase involved in cell wall bisynthesis [Kaistella antarctica]VEH99519.1 Probable poly(glycerol-phosphate) alpha-glucosyltransferase [Kaistella antarctica]
MKIVFNTDQIFLHGGIEKVMATKANYLANQNDVKIFIVTTEQLGNPPCYPLDQKIILIDLGINYNRAKSYFSQENLGKAKQHFIRQRKLFKELNPDFIISPNYNFDHYWLPFIKNKAKVLKERHGSRFFETQQRKDASFVKRLKFTFNDYIDGLYDCIVVLNNDEKSYVHTNNTVVIPNPTELSLLRADLTQKQVIAAGRISPVKAFDQLIEVWSLVNKDFPDWQLHFYGQDYLDTQKKLEELVKKLQLQAVVQFKGSVDNLTETMTNYSIYAMTSETECFPMVLLEAFSVGLPVISYDCPNGPRNILTNGEDSILIPDKNIPIFAARLKELMQNENLRQQMGTKGLENVQRFSLEKVMHQWKDLFKSLLS